MLLLSAILILSDFVKVMGLRISTKQVPSDQASAILLIS